MDLSASIVFSQGEFRRYDEAKIGLLTHGLHYGTGCFEGVRGYWVPEEKELYLVHLREHFDRLAVSAKTLLMDLPFSTERLIEIATELCRRNAAAGPVYLRPFIYKCAEEIGVRLKDVPDNFAMLVVPFGRYYDNDAGLNVGVSSWRRMDDVIAPSRAKITGIYINSALAKSEAQLNGFDEAIMLSHDGHVSEGSAENIFMIKRNVLYTPDASQNILEGVTRRSIMTLAREELGLEVLERAIDRSELYGAEEVFFTGTAVGVEFARAIDRRPVGDGTIGPITRKLRVLYEDAVRGRIPKYAHWVTHTYAGAAHPVA